MRNTRRLRLGPTAVSLTNWDTPSHAYYSFGHATLFERAPCAYLALPVAPDVAPAQWPWRAARSDPGGLFYCCLSTPRDPSFRRLAPSNKLPLALRPFLYFSFPFFLARAPLLPLSATAPVDGTRLRGARTRWEICNSDNNRLWRSIRRRLWLDFGYFGWRKG